VTVANASMKSGHSSQIRRYARPMRRVMGIRVLASSEVDGMKDGKLDLDDEGSWHSSMWCCFGSLHMNLERGNDGRNSRMRFEQSDTHKLSGTPTGTSGFGRDAYAYDREREFGGSGAQHGVVMECNASRSAWI